MLTEMITWAIDAVGRRVVGMMSNASERKSARTTRRAFIGSTLPASTLACPVRLCYTGLRGLMGQIAWGNPYCIQTHSIGLCCWKLSCMKTCKLRSTACFLPKNSTSGKVILAQGKILRRAALPAATAAKLLICFEIHPRHQKQHCDDERHSRMCARCIVQAHSAVNQPYHTAGEPDFVRELHPHP